ncbi:MAG: hypothetical protein PHP25_00060 [Candidatus Moranbacteria bacterium]|nr:hypothetical protein [Candidatus Moranbacteria bacterium]
MSAAPATTANSKGNAGNSGTNPAHGGNYVSPRDQSDVGNMLNRQRRQENGDGPGQGKADSPNLQNLAKTAAASPQSAARQAAELVLSMFRQIEPTKDWPYLFMTLPFSLLKDLLDLGCAGLDATVPGLGTVVLFILSLMLTILTIISLILIGEKLSSRKSGKYFAGLGIEFVSEALPGLGWLPLAFFETAAIYSFVLYDRATAPEPQSEEATA